MKKIYSTKSQGVTIIEMTIVIALLSIIAVIFFLSYEFFVKKSKVTKIAIDAKEYTRTLESFHLVYGGLPGDLASAKRRISSDLIDGDGDGRIQNETEQFQVWPHLSKSNMLEQNFQTLATNTTPELGINLPAIRNSDNLAIGVIYNTPSGYRANSFIIGGLNGRDVSRPVLTQGDIRLGDQKYDDNNPTGGSWMCGKNPPSPSDCNYSNTALDGENFMLYLPITRSLASGSSSSSCPAQSLQIGQLVANIPEVQPSNFYTGTCRDTNANYAGDYKVQCTQQASGQYALEIILNSCTLKTCAYSDTTADITDSTSVQSGKVTVGNNLIYSCASPKVPKQVKCVASLTDDTASFDATPECVDSTTIGTPGNIPIYQTDVLFKDSGKKFNDVGSTSNDILTAEKVYQLLGKTTIENNYVTKFDANNNKLLQSILFDNASTVGIRSNESTAWSTTPPSSKALLELRSTVQGFLPPRMTEQQRNNLVSSLTTTEKTALAGLVVFNTDSGQLQVWDGAAWNASFWSKTNTTDKTTNPTADIKYDKDIAINSILIGKGNGSGNAGSTALGVAALKSGTTGQWNTAIGNSVLMANTTGNNNTAIGNGSLIANTTGSDNTATGLNSLWANTTGSDNTAFGKYSLTYNTTGIQNTAVGRDALFANTTGNRNTALGYLAGNAITTGSSNVVIGDSINPPSVTGNNQIAIGAGGNIKILVDSNGNTGLGTTSPNTKSLLELKSSSKGFLPPRMTQTQRDTIITSLNSEADPVAAKTALAGLIIYNQTIKALETWNGVEWVSDGGGIDTTPVGTVVAWASNNTPPDGWLLLNGQTFSTSAYPQLASIFPSGQLPDFRGYFLRGNGTNTDGTASGPFLEKQNYSTAMPTKTFSAANAGSHSHSGSIGNAGSHSHSIQGYVRTNYDANDIFSDFQGLDTGANSYNTSSDGEHSHPLFINPAENHSHPIAGGDSETRPKNIAVHYIIKAKTLNPGASDARLKENIVDYKFHKENLMKVKLRSYSWKDKKHYGYGVQYGVVAQELKELFPEFVHMGRDGYYFVDYDRLSLPLISTMQDMITEQKEVKQKIHLLEIIVYSFIGILFVMISVIFIMLIKLKNNAVRFNK